MAFLLYERLMQNGAPTLRPTGEHFRLAGSNLIYQAWEKRSKPTNHGWHVSADELIMLHTGGAHNYQTRRLIIDFHPGVAQRISLIELLDIYAYTHQGDTPEEAAWTPMMLRLQDVLYKEYDHAITPEHKQAIIANIPEAQTGEDFVEFLYLNGRAWNWGRNGSTNAGFLHRAAREYFRKFF